MRPKNCCLMSLSRPPTGTRYTDGRSFTFPRQQTLICHWSTWFKQLMVPQSHRYQSHGPTGTLMLVAYCSHDHIKTPRSHAWKYEFCSNECAINRKLTIIRVSPGFSLRGRNGSYGLHTGSGGSRRRGCWECIPPISQYQQCFWWIKFLHNFESLRSNNNFYALRCVTQNRMRCDFSYVRWRRPRNS